jgi:hypothetical protein
MTRKPAKKMMPARLQPPNAGGSRPLRSLGLPGEHYGVWCQPTKGPPRWWGLDTIELCITRSAAEKLCAFALRQPEVVDAFVMPIILPHVNARRFPWPKQSANPKPNPSPIQRLLPSPPPR